MREHVKEAGRGRRREAHLGSNEFIGVTEDLGKGFEKRFRVSESLHPERAEEEEEEVSVSSQLVFEQEKEAVPKNSRDDLPQTSHRGSDDLGLFAVESFDHVTLQD